MEYKEDCINKKDCEEAKTNCPVNCGDYEESTQSNEGVKKQ